MPQPANSRARGPSTAAQRSAQGWTATLRPADGGERTLTARALVNAAGPWAPEVRALAGLSGRAALRRVKGSHIVVPRLYLHDHAYLLQNDDRRIVFVMPFEVTVPPLTAMPAAFTPPLAVIEPAFETPPAICD